MNVLGRLTATLQAALAAMKPLRKTLELLLSQEVPQPAAVLPARSSHVSPGAALGGALTLEAGSQARYSTARRARSSSLLQAFAVAGRGRASEGLEPGVARSIRRATGETDQLLCRMPSSELRRSARTSRDTRVGARGPQAHSCVTQAVDLLPKSITFLWWTWTSTCTLCIPSGCLVHELLGCAWPGVELCRLPRV